jgi:hypothetical protein
MQSPHQSGLYNKKKLTFLIAARAFLKKENSLSDHKTNFFDREKLPYYNKLWTIVYSRIPPRIDSISNGMFVWGYTVLKKFFHFLEIWYVATNVPLNEMVIFPFCF